MRNNDHSNDQGNDDHRDDYDDTEEVLTPSQQLEADALYNILLGHNPMPCICGLGPSFNECCRLTIGF